MAQYARAYRLSRHTLYVARRLMAQQAKVATKRRRGAASATPKPGPFVAVRVVASPVALRATLANGVTLGVASAEPAACATLLGLLAAPPCSN